MVVASASHSSVSSPRTAHVSELPPASASSAQASPRFGQQSRTAEHGSGDKEAQRHRVSPEKEAPRRDDIRALIPPLELTSELNPRNFALILLQRLGNSGVSNLESAVRGFGVRGISGDAFIDACLRCLAHSVLLPDACSYPWQRRSAITGASQVRQYESDPLVATMGFLPTSVTSHAGMNFVDPGDQYAFFSDGGHDIERRTKFLSRVVEQRAKQYAPLQSSIECFDQAGSSLQYALTLLYHAIDVHNSNALSWEELSTYFSDVTTRGASRLGTADIDKYVTLVSREISFPRALRIETGPQGGQGGASGGGGETVMHIPTAPPSIECGAYDALHHRFAIRTSGGALVLLDGSSFAISSTVLSNDEGRGFGATVAMEYFNRVQRGGGGGSALDDGGGSGIIALSTADCVVRLYDDTTHQMLCTNPFGSAQSALRYIPSLRRMMCGARSGLVSMLISRNHSRWRAETFSLAMNDRVNDIAFLQRSAQVAAASASGQLTTFDADNGKVTFSFQSPTPCDITSVDYSPYFDVLAFAGPRQCPTLLCPGSGFTPIRIQESESAHEVPIKKIQFVAGSPELISCDVSGLMKIWDLRMFQCVQTVQTCRRVPKTLYNFPNDKVAKKSFALRSLVTLHETSPEFRSPCHDLVFTTMCGSRLVAMDGRGVQVLQPHHTFMESQRAMQSKAAALATTTTMDDGRERPSGENSEGSGSQIAARDTVKSLEVVNLPDTFVLPQSITQLFPPPPPTVSRDAPLSTVVDGAGVFPQGRRLRSLRRIPVQIAVTTAEQELRAAKEEQQRQLMVLSSRREQLIVGHSDCTLYLWRVSTGEAVLSLPLREAYKQWANTNLEMMSTARETKKRDMELAALQFSSTQSPSREAANSGASESDISSSVAAMAEMQLQHMKIATERAARDAAHPRFFLLESCQPRQQQQDIASSLTITSCYLGSFEEVAVDANASVKMLKALFDVGLADGTCVQVPFTLMLSPPSKRHDSLMDGCSSISKMPTLRGMFDFSQDPPYAIFRSTHFRSQQMIADVAAGAEAPPPEVTCIRGLRVVTTVDHPHWLQLGQPLEKKHKDNDCDDDGDEDPDPSTARTATSSSASTRWTTAKQVTSGVSLVGAIKSEKWKKTAMGEESSLWLLDNRIRKTEGVVRVAAGAVAVVYLARMSLPTACSIGLADPPAVADVSLQLTSEEPGRAHAVSLWCDKRHRTSKAAATSSPNSPVEPTDDAVVAEGSSPPVTTVTESDDIVVYVGMSNNVSLFYTLRVVYDSAAARGGENSLMENSMRVSSPTGRRARSLSIIQQAQQQLKKSSIDAAERFVVHRVVRLRTMPDNAIIRRSFPISSTSLVVAADSVGGVQLMFAPLMQRFYPVCLSRFTAFQPAHEQYTPLVVAADCSEHGLLFLAAGSHVSVYSLQRCWKSCFPTEWADKWHQPQEITVEANAVLINVDAEHPSSTVDEGKSRDSTQTSTQANAATQLEEQIRQQPPTPSLVRYFDVSELCDRITSMVYVAEKKCLLVGASDGALHTFTLWGVHVSCNTLPTSATLSVQTTPAVLSGGEARKENVVAVDALHSHDRRHLSALTCQNDSGVSVVFNACGGALGEMQPSEDDVPFPWGQGKPPSIFRNTKAFVAMDVLEQKNEEGGGHTNAAMHRGGGGVRASFLQADTNRLQATSRGVMPSKASQEIAILDGIANEAVTSALASAAVSSEEEEDNDNSSEDDSTQHGGLKRYSSMMMPSSPFRSRQGSAVFSDFGSEDTRGDGARPSRIGPPTAVHKILFTQKVNDGTSSSGPLNSSATLVQPSDAQRRHANDDATSGGTHDDHKSIGLTVEALLNQDIFDRFQHLEGESKQSHIMIGLMERAAQHKQAKKDVKDTQRRLVHYHSSLMESLHHECDEALHSCGDLRYEDEPNLRDHVNLNSVKTSEAFHRDGTQKPSSSRKSVLVHDVIQNALVPSSSKVDVSVHNVTTAAGSSSGGELASITKHREERELLSFASAAGSLVKRFRQSRSQSLHAALCRLVGSERELAGNLSVEADLEAHLANDARFEEDLLITARTKRMEQLASNSNSSIHASRDRNPLQSEVSMAGDGSRADGEFQQFESAPLQGTSSFFCSSSNDDTMVQSPVAGTSELHRYKAFGEDEGEGVDRGVNPPQSSDPEDLGDEIFKDTVEVIARSNRRRSSASFHRGSFGVSSDTAASPVDSSTAIGSPRSANRRRSSGATDVNSLQSFSIQKTEALATRRKSVTMMSALSNGKGNESTSSLRWTNLVADRKGMRRKSKVLIQEEGATSPSPPSPNNATSTGLQDEANRCSMSPVAFNDVMCEPLGDVGLNSTLAHDGSPSVSKTRETEQEQELGHSSALLRMRTIAPTNVIVAESASSSIRVQCGSLLQLRALESVVDASCSTRRHQSASISRRLFHRCKAPPIANEQDSLVSSFLLPNTTGSGGMTIGRHSVKGASQQRPNWDDGEDEELLLQQQLSEWSHQAGKRLYGGGGGGDPSTTLPVRPISAMSTGSRNHSSTPAVLRPSSTMSRASSVNVARASRSSSSSLLHNVIFQSDNIQRRLQKKR